MVTGVLQGSGDPFYNDEGVVIDAGTYSITGTFLDGTGNFGIITANPNGLVGPGGTFPSRSSNLLLFRGKIIFNGVGDQEIDGTTTEMINIIGFPSYPGTTNGNTLVGSGRKILHGDFNEVGSFGSGFDFVGDAKLYLGNYSITGTDPDGFASVFPGSLLSPSKYVVTDGSGTLKLAMHYSQFDIGTAANYLPLKIVDYVLPIDKDGNWTSYPFENPATAKVSASLPPGLLASNAIMAKWTLSPSLGVNKVAVEFNESLMPADFDLATCGGIGVPALE